MVPRCGEEEKSEAVRSRRVRSHLLTTTRASSPMLRVSPANTRQAAAKKLGLGAPSDALMRRTLPVLCSSHTGCDSSVRNWSRPERCGSIKRQSCESTSLPSSRHIVVYARRRVLALACCWWKSGVALPRKRPPARLFMEMDWGCGRPRVGRACALQAARRRRRPDAMISAGPGPPRRMAERGGQHDRNHPQNQAHNEGVHSPIIAEPTPFSPVQCRNFF